MMYFIRTHLKIASKHAQIRGQNSRSSSENFGDVIQGITHCQFPCFIGKQGKGGC